MYFSPISWSIPVAHGAVLHLWSVGSLRWSTVARDRGQKFQCEYIQKLVTLSSSENDMKQWDRGTLQSHTHSRSQSAWNLDETIPQSLLFFLFIGKLFLLKSIYLHLQNGGQLNMNSVWLMRTTGVDMMMDDDDGSHQKRKSSLTSCFSSPLSWGPVFPGIPWPIRKGDSWKYCSWGRGLSTIPCTVLYY